MAREAGLCYAGVGIVTNVAAGLGDDEPVSIEGIGVTREQHGAALEKVLANALEAVSGSGPSDCGCPGLLGAWQSAAWFGERSGNG
jgi:hypothetical protein